MPLTDSFLESPDGTQAEIMRSTYYALCEHGFADLTIDRIGAEFTYYQHGEKDNLLLEFLEFMTERFEGFVPFDDADSAKDQHPTELIESGIDKGVFKDVNAEAKANFLLTLITGSMVNCVTSSHGSIETILPQVEVDIQATLLENYE